MYKICEKYNEVTLTYTTRCLHTTKIMRPAESRVLETQGVTLTMLSRHVPVLLDLLSKMGIIISPNILRTVAKDWYSYLDLNQEPTA